MQSCAAAKSPASVARFTFRAAALRKNAATTRGERILKRVLFAVAAITIAVFGYQVLSARDPENVSFEQSRSAAYALAAQHCRQLDCDLSQGTHGLFLDHYRSAQGWVWVFRTRRLGGETHVLFPDGNPQQHRIVEPPASP